MTSGAPRPSGLRNPERTARSLGAGLLVMQAIVVGLAIPVINHGAAHRPGAAATWTVAAIAVALLLTAGLVGRPAGLVVGSLLQVATVAAGLWSATLLFLGVVFAVLWATWLWQRRTLLASVRAVAAGGPDQPPAGRPAEPPAERPAQPPAEPTAMPDQ